MVLKVVVGIADTCTVYRDGEPPEGTPYISACDTEIPQETGRLLYDQALCKFYIAHESPAPPTEQEITAQAFAELSMAQAQQHEQTQQALAELTIMIAGGMTNEV